MTRLGLAASTPSKRYGAAEIQEFQPRALLLSFVLSAIVVQSVASLLSWWWTSTSENPRTERPPGRVGIVITCMPELPPRIPDGRTPVLGAVIPSIGIPVPVPERFVDTTASFPTIGQLWGLTTGEEGAPGPAEEPGPVPEIEPEPFVVHEVEPSIAVRVDPVYPPVAIRAGLEGNVFVRVWVDTRGAVRKAEVLKSDGDLFDAPALDAVRRWVFTPALMQNRPVGVWITIPIRFRLSTH